MQRRNFIFSKAAWLGLWLSPVSLVKAWAEKRDPLLGFRLWSAKDYTRLTLETHSPLKAQLLEKPLRLELSQAGVFAQEIEHKLGAIQERVQADAYLKQLTVQNRGGNLLLNLDLKVSVRPELFQLKPVAAYGYRVVLDLHPKTAPDPLASLIAEKSKNQQDPLGDFLRQRDGKTSVKTSDKNSGLASATQEKPSKPAGKKRVFLIALDPGHGGEDPGAIGPAGTYEKDVVLAIAQRLQALINANSSMRAFLTRDGDYFVPLQERVRKAQTAQADLLLSIHADAFTRPSAKGASVYALSTKGASSASARWLADKENQSDAIGGVALKVADAQAQRAILDMSTTAQIKDSLKVGGLLTRTLGGMTTMHKNAVEQANFAVLRAPGIPSVLVETAFISNPEEEQLLASDAHQQRIATALMAGLKRYFAANTATKA